MKCAIKKCISNALNIQENEKQNISYYRFSSGSSGREQFQNHLETITVKNELNSSPLDVTVDNDNIMYLCSLHLHREIIDKRIEWVDGLNSVLPDAISINSKINNKEQENDTEIEISNVKIECDLHVNEYDSIVDMATKYDLQNTCRTCRAQNVSLEKIFKDLNEISNTPRFNIADELMYLRLDISDDDQLPQKICIKCVNHLSKINSFRMECKLSQTILNNYIKNKMEIDKQISVQQQEILQEKTINMKEFEFININENPNDNRDSKIKENVGIAVKSSNGKVHINNTNLIIENENSSENAQDDNNSIISNVIKEITHSANRSATSKKRIPIEEKAPPNESNRPEPFCDKCGKHFKHIRSCKAHITKGICIENKEKHRKTYSLYTCSICNKNFRKANNFAIHMKSHDTENLFKCEICERILQSENSLVRHIKCYHTISEHTCPHCSMQFNNELKYLWHLKSHNKSFKCKYCNKSFVQSNRLKLHEEVHTGARSYLCNICGKEFLSKNILVRHLLWHKSERPFNCSFCKKGCLTRSELTIHMRTHTGDRPYNCDLCDKGFTQSSALTIHMRMHTGERPYKCELCDKDYREKSSITKHMRTHQSPRSQTRSIRKYLCGLCNKSFLIAESLTWHMKMHTDDRKYKCTLCPSAFKRQKTLRVHINGVHLKKKPYKCEECDKTFSQRNAKTIHMRVHTGERPYKCELCNSYFASSVRLSRHTRKHHKM